MARRTKGFLAQTAAAVAAAGLVASGVAAGATAGASTRAHRSHAATTAITVGIPPVISAAGIYLAEKEGYFAKEGLKINVKLLNGGAATVPALESGALQIAQSNVLSEIQGAQQGINVPCFAGAFQLPKTGHTAPLIGHSSADPKSLVGKTVAVNATDGVNQLMAEAFLAAHGVNYKAVHFIGMPFPNMPAALKSGEVAAAVPFEPFSTLMLAQGAKLITGTVEQDVPGHPIFACWNGSASWIASHRAVVKRFVAAINQADRFIAAKPLQFERIASTYIKLPSAVIGKLSLPVYTTAMTKNDITNWEKAAVKYGIMAKGGVPASKVLVQP